MRKKDLVTRSLEIQAENKACGLDVPNVNLTSRSDKLTYAAKLIEKVHQRVALEDDDVLDLGLAVTLIREMIK